MSRFSFCLVTLVFTLATSAHGAALDASITTVAGAPVEDAAVVVEPINAPMPKRRSGATIEQRDREFTPYVTIVQTGTAIDFPNNDSIKHHLYSFSAAKSFEVKLYAGKPSQPVVFDKPGEIALGCNIHDWMEAYILAVDTPYFAKTDSKGHARVANLPAGRYRLKIWHPRQKNETPVREINLSGASSKIEAVLDLLPRIAKIKPALDASDY